MFDLMKMNFFIDIFMIFLQNINSYRISIMTLSQSKLQLQLSKQQKVTQRSSFSEQVIDDIYGTICKLEPKNLMLTQFLSLVIEKQFLKNSSKIAYFAELYEEVRGKNLDQEHGYNKNSLQQEQQKFSKKKFVKLLREMAKKIFPGHVNPYQTVLYEKLVRTDLEDHRIKIDDSLKKMLTKQTINSLDELDKEFQTIFQIYMPENYNQGLEFTWEEIKILEKKLPIICFLRFLYEAEVVPHFISGAQFLQIISKLKTPSLPNTSSNKEAMFYTSETFSSYLRDQIHLPNIKLIEGDIGLTFFEMQILFIKLATEFSKDIKGEYSVNIKKLSSYIKIKQAFEDGAPRRNKFMQTVRSFTRNQSCKNDKIVLKKRQSKKKIQDLYDSKQVQFKQQAAKDIYRNMVVDIKQIQQIRKDLDSQLPQLPAKRKIQKQNDASFDPEKKHIVIGQQLPKIQEKNKPNVQKEGKKKNDDGLMGYKPIIEKPVEQSCIQKLVRRPKKMRINTQYPIILNEVFYPSSLKPLLSINPKAQLYLETSYIHLGERLYEQAFLNCLKAKQLMQSKSSIIQYYFNLHNAQIFQSAGRDDLSLSYYHKAKDLLAVLTSLEGLARSHSYTGMGAALFHMEEYQYALRCFEKAKVSYGVSLIVDSIDNAIFQNNIGCCLMMLGRNQQAIKYFELSHNILDLKSGCFDERTLVVQQNYNKNRKAYLQLLPEYKTMWKTYMEKSTTKLPAVKAAPKKK